MSGFDGSKSVRNIGQMLEHIFHRLSISVVGQGERLQRNGKYRRDINGITDDVVKDHVAHNTEGGRIARN